MIIPPPSHDSTWARLCRMITPGYSYCLRCGMPWSRVGAHSTPIGEGVAEAWLNMPEDMREAGVRPLCGTAVFPLCEDCWAKLTPRGRMDYYFALMEAWRLGGHPSEVPWAVVYECVMAGL